MQTAIKPGGGGAAADSAHGLPTAAAAAAAAPPHPPAATIIKASLSQEKKATPSNTALAAKEEEKAALAAIKANKAGEKSKGKARGGGATTSTDSPPPAPAAATTPATPAVRASTPSKAKGSSNAGVARTISISTGANGSLGLRLKSAGRNGGATVDSVTKSGAASLAGACKGDMIMKVGGVPVMDLTVSQIGSLIKGAGSVVELVVMGTGKHKAAPSTPRRAAASTPSASSPSKSSSTMQNSWKLAMSGFSNALRAPPPLRSTSNEGAPSAPNSPMAYAAISRTPLKQAPSEGAAAGANCDLDSGSASAFGQ